MLKHVSLLVLLVALTTCERERGKGRGGGARDRAKEMAKDAAIDNARERVGDLDREEVSERVKNVDREGVKEKARGKGGRFKELMGGKNLSKKKLLSMKPTHLPTGIHLPTGQRGAPKACTDAALGESPGMSRIRKGSKDKFYVCAFVNFQYRIGSDKESGDYTADNVDMRFGLFKTCVDEVNKQNKKFRDGTATWTAGINYFCDMTEEEQRPFFNGIVMPERGMFR